MSEQKKKVQIRFQTTSSSSANINHDFRKSKVSYLRNDMHHNKYENKYFGFKPDELKKQANESWNEYNELYKKANKRNLRKGRQSDCLTGVITLSPIINDWLEDETVKKADLDKAFVDSIPLIEKKIHDIVQDDSIKLSHYVIHYDEKTPHLHFAFNNHTKDGQAVFNIMRNSKRLSEFQDIVGETFKEIGLERGERKSTAKHMSVRQMHEEELKQIKSKIKNLQEVKKELKNNIDDKKELKNQLDDIDKSIRNARETLKRENSTIDSLKLEKERLRASMDDLRPVNKDVTIYSVDSIIEHITETNTYTIKENMLKSKDIEITKFINEKKLREILTQYNQDLKKVKNAPIYNQKLEEDLKEKTRELEIAKAKSKSYLGLNQTTNERVKELETTVTELEKDLYEYQQAFNELDEILLTEYDRDSYLNFDEVIERVKDNIQELENAKERIKQLETDLYGDSHNIKRFKNK